MVQQPPPTAFAVMLRREGVWGMQGRNISCGLGTSRTPAARQAMSEGMGLQPSRRISDKNFHI